MTAVSRAVAAAIERTIGKEGRYSNNPHDTGGETMWGITASVARRWGYHGPMRDLPRTTAVRIYTQEYFLGPRFDEVAKTTHAVAEELFDTGVNMGQRTATRFLQRSLNVLNKSHDKPLFPDLEPDGQLGKETLSALDTFLQSRGKEGEVVLLTMLNSLQGTRYIELCEARVQNEEFVYGWFRHRVVI